MHRTLLHFEGARSSRVAKLNSNEPKTCLPLLLQLIKPPFMLRNTFYADNPFGATATVAGTPEPELDNVTDKRWKYLCNKVRRFRLKCGRVRGYNFIVCLLVHFLAFLGIYSIWSVYEGVFIIDQVDTDRFLQRIHFSQKIRLLFLTKFWHYATLARTTITAKSTLRARHPIFWPSTGLPTKQPHISRWL